MVPRLPWRRNSPSGYIAFPEGERFAKRRAEIRFEAVSSTPWLWFTYYDGAVDAGNEHHKQLAANKATEQWPLTKRKGIVFATEQAEREVLRTNVQRMMAKGDLPLSIFGIETAPAEKLARIIWLIKDAKGLEGPAKPLVEACSAELYRRRTEAGREAGA